MTATTSKLGADMTRDDAIHMVKEYARSVVHERNDQTAMRFWHIVNLLARQPAAPSVEQDECGVCDRYQVLNEAGEALLAANHGEAYEVIYRMMKDARAASTSANVAQGANLDVWYGPMPESNGKTNWTAILHRGDVTSGITIDVSEYPDRVRYEADRMRWMIGELDEEPFILDYDADKHSGYVANVAQGAEAVCEHEWAPMTKPHKECVKCGDVRLDTAPPAQTAITDDARDAERYRWLRDFNVRSKDGVDIKPPCEHVHASIYSHAVGTIPAVRLAYGEELDRTIDDALTAAQSASGDTK
jgi:hypothetical protein